MSQLGQKRKLRCSTAKSAIPPKADIPRRLPDVRFVPCVDGSELARDIFTFTEFSRCSHVFGLFARFT
jgi:hypothetical protein